MAAGGLGRGVAPFDASRLEVELDRYQDWMDTRCEAVYELAGRARAKGLDLRDVVEIPRAADLASRTEKLLEEYLDGIEVADDIRVMLAEKDRETTSIAMAVSVAEQMHERTQDLQKAIDTGLRVGLAILTEAVLVAPLEGIGRVQILSNEDGSRFVSVDFCGPIRAAGGTAQALAVLIADMIRRALGLAKYEPSTPEVERVKEEFGLYRGGLQYRPPPEEVEMIVRACPIMVNGEETEQIECAGYREVRNIEGARVRGGVLLVIGEGLCLKAPKIQKHTERLEIPGWEFISHFASKGKKDADANGAANGVRKGRRRAITKESRFMEDIIAGRPVFGEPGAPGGFRLRYGRPRSSGLAAAGMHPTSMTAMGAFLAVGTQMKIERPGKACAVTPCEELEGPTVLLRSGRFGRIQETGTWERVEPDVISIWDNGELMLGYGEFAENNKHLVPSGYVADWFASDLITALDDASKVDRFAEILGVERRSLPEGIPATGALADGEPGLGGGGGSGPTATGSALLEASDRQRDWHRHLRRRAFSWDAIVELSRTWLTGIPAPWNLWWHDLPIEFAPLLADAMEGGRFEPAGRIQDGLLLEPAPAETWLRIPGAATDWRAIDRRPEALPTTKKSAKVVKRMTRDTTSAPEREMPDVMPGGTIEMPRSVMGAWPRWVQHEEHGPVKAALMVLGVPHHHDGGDLLLTQNWQPLLEGLGFVVPAQGDATPGASPSRRAELAPHVTERVARLAEACTITADEAARREDLESRRAAVRIEAETAARQRGETIAATEAAGRAAVDEIPDPGPADAERLEWAEALLDEHEVDGALWLVRRCSDLRWVAAAPCRVGCRMGRPEKAAPREMKPAVHSLFPIGNEGGPQRLLPEAASRGNLRVALGVRTCEKCGQRSPHVICHHRPDPD